MQKENNMEPCPICNEPMKYASLGHRDAYSVDCSVCGEYHITRTALANLKNSEMTGRQRANISGWLRENSIYEIKSDSLEYLANLSTPSFHEKADKLLLLLDKQTEHAGQELIIVRSWRGYASCLNEEEFNEVLSYLVSTERISNDNIMCVKIEPEGWAYIETLKKVNIESTQGFVAMWFSDDMQRIYEDFIAPGIRDAGYSPHRVDQREHNDKIDDEIIAQIRKSRFVLADFTGHRGGVYYEAGFAKGLNLEVFWTCREDEVDRLHFDIRQYNCIVWSGDKLDEFRRKITNRVEAVIGKGKLSG